MERNLIEWFPLAPRPTPTGDLVHNPGMWRLGIQQPLGSQESAPSTEPHQPGLITLPFQKDLNFPWPHLAILNLMYRVSQEVRLVFFCKIKDIFHFHQYLY